MSSTTRVGFLAPDATDLADEVLYYDGNITVYEAELPSVMSVSLPGSGSYTGQIKTVPVAANGSIAPPYPASTYVWDGTRWTLLGDFGIKKDLQYSYFPLSYINHAPPIASSGAEVIGSRLSQFDSFTIAKNQLIRFNCNACIGLANNTTANADFEGSFNLFIDPNSSTAPLPTTPGVIRLSFPIRMHPFTNDPTINTCYSMAYGELFYQSTYSGSGTQTLGLSAYLSVVGKNNVTNGGSIINWFNTNGLPATTISIETIGQK